MATSAKLDKIVCRIDPTILKEWKKFVNHDETLKHALEEALRCDIKRRREGK